MQKPKGTYDVYGEYGKKVTSLLKILETYYLSIKKD